MSAPTFDAPPNASNHFAWLRTQMGLQRTLMAAVRTAVSLIGFGFTVAQFFQRLQTSTDGGDVLNPATPRNLGLILIAAGIVSLIVFTWQYHTTSSYLRAGAFAALAAPTRPPLHNATYFVSFIVIAIGLAAFASVFARF